MNAPDLVTQARTALAAATSTEDLALATHYAATARLALEQLRAEASEIERLLVAHEQEIVRRAYPRGQLEIGGPR